MNLKSHSAKIVAGIAAAISSLYSPAERERHKREFARTFAPFPVGVMPFEEFGTPEQLTAESLSNLETLKSYGIFTPNDVVAVRQPLYDRLNYSVAGVTGNLRFFQAQLGQGVTTAIAGAGGVKTLDDTNMELAGQLPAGRAFLATSIEIIIEPGSVTAANAWSPLDPAFLTNASAANISNVPALAGLNDLNRLGISGWLQFVIGQGQYLTSSRLDSFPPKSYICPDAAVTGDGNLGFAGVALARAVGKPFYINPPILLMPSVNFVVTLNWNAAVALLVGNARITCRLDGIEFRRAQ